MSLIKHWKLLWVVIILIFLLPAICFFITYPYRYPIQLPEIVGIPLISPLMAIVLLFDFPIQIGLYYLLAYGLLAILYKRYDLEKKSKHRKKLGFS